ncbi:MAG TPA: bifunctional YncE family protein/alkaline phosphatase family protein [Candidatus Binatia bacterium]|nr:bifunctional YncE family protein/alkaline phosphatase family protein [Candidatus Binatia bacterium]
MISLAGLWSLLLTIVLPSGWVLQPAPALFVRTNTMPQGAAASPDGRELAVVESGFNPPALGVYDAATLKQAASIPLRGAFGRPLWLDARRVLVAGANAQAILDVDTVARSVRRIPLPPHTYPVSIARYGERIAVATDDDGNVRIGTLAGVASSKPVHVGTHPGALAFSPNGETLFAADRAGSAVKAIDVRTLAVRTIATGLHPNALAIAGDRLYVSESDDDSVGIYRIGDGARIADVFVGDAAGTTRLYGASPNALAFANGTLYVSLGAANTVAAIRDGRVVGRIDAGRYPTDIVALHDRLYVVDGKGEAVPANPRFEVFTRSNVDYVAAIEFGSIRAYALPGAIGPGTPQGATGWQSPAPPDTVVRPNGPIAHVFYILKENRSYDQILGDIAEGNGDAKLAFFGSVVTPNEHAISQRFGLFDNAYTNGEVSDPGHDWSGAAFANDYVERAWPPTYGGRADGDDTGEGFGAAQPHSGYIWDAAARAHVSFRDYGEMVTAPTLGHRYDPHYVGWDLSYSDLNRYREWKREFDSFVARGDVPQFEYIWLPNDHTSGSRPGKLTPAAYIAQNDYAVGLVVDAISHSPVWKSSAIFVIEDDSQDGADHVSAQRTTMYFASPYAAGGVRSEHYTTQSILRTIELILGIPPLSTYDAMAVPLYAAFATRADLRPYVAIPPKIDITARNSRTAYASRLSATLDFSRPDAIAPGVLRDIIAHDAGYTRLRDDLH